MDCLKFQEQIEMELDGELSQADKPGLERHLLICPDCQEFRAEAEMLFNVLQGELMVEPPSNLVGPVMAKVARRRAWRVAGFLAAMPLAVISLGPMVRQAMVWTLRAVLNWEPTWLTTLWGSIWRTFKVLYRAWVMVSSAMPDEYWLGLAVLAILNLTMLLKLMGSWSGKGGDSL